jgi:hypothetical protein
MQALRGLFRCKRLSGVAITVANEPAAGLTTNLPRFPLTSNTSVTAGCCSSWGWGLVFRVVKVEPSGVNYSAAPLLGLFCLWVLLERVSWFPQSRGVSALAIPEYEPLNVHVSPTRLSPELKESSLPLLENLQAFRSCKKFPANVMPWCLSEIT